MNGSELPPNAEPGQSDRQQDNGAVMASKPQPPRDPWAWLYWGLFFILVPLTALWMAHKPAPQVSLPVPARDLPPYHVIMASDLITASIPLRQVTGETVRDSHELFGRYTLRAFRAGQPFPRDQVVAIPDPTLISNTLVVGIPADSATILGGNLRPGDVVTLAAVPTSDAAASVRVLDAVLVLDVKLTGDETTVVLAIPTDRWPEYLIRGRNTVIMLARRVEW